MNMPLDFTIGKRYTFYTKVGDTQGWAGVVEEFHSDWVRINMDHHASALQPRYEFLYWININNIYGYMEQRERL